MSFDALLLAAYCLLLGIVGSISIAWSTQTPRPKSWSVLLVYFICLMVFLAAVERAGHIVSTGSIEWYQLAIVSVLLLVGLGIGVKFFTAIFRRRDKSLKPRT